jgi:UDPglucose 6-dehydrogenase
MKKVKLGIIGHGFVGQATDHGFFKVREKFIVDPRYGTTIEELKNFQPDFIFICVPTPMKKDGSQDSSIVKNVFKELENNFKGTPKILKSTILPDLLNKLTNDQDSFVYNPEFLREKHANEDFVNSPFVILGGKKSICKEVELLYRNFSSCLTKKYINVDMETASLIKYSINSFLATKVLFFNGIKDIFDELDTKESWFDFINILSLDERIGDSHMSVPGHDGKRGFGGACFTKDTAALISYSDSISKKFELLQKTVSLNNSLRKSYKNLDKREKDQNVNYDFSND